MDRQIHDIFQTMLPRLSSTLNPYTRAGSGVTGLTSQSNQNLLIDIVETKENIMIYVEIPGVNKENFTLRFYNNEITIIVDKNSPYERQELYQSEIHYGHIERTIYLPICITNRETVKANIHNGILRIQIDKRVEEQNQFTVNVDDTNED